MYGFLPSKDATSDALKRGFSELSDGILYENFPQEEPRETLFLWNEDEWKDIHNGLCKIAEEIRVFSLEIVKEMAYSVL